MSELLELQIFLEDTNEIKTLRLTPEKQKSIKWLVYCFFFTFILDLYLIT